MMGTTPSHQEQALFSYHLNLERRLRSDHPLRPLRAALDLSFVLPAVQGLYGRSGHVSLDPRVIVKMMLLLFYYNIASERELMAQIGERLDFLWFLGFDLETPIPDHSVLSKARARWRGLARQRLQGWLICACQNLRLLVKHSRQRLLPAAGVGTVLAIFAQTAQRVSPLWRQESARCSSAKSRGWFRAWLARWPHERRTHGSPAFC